MRVPPIVLVIGAISSIQLGAAIATTLFDDLGPEGVSLLRLGFAALILVAVWRPRPRAHARGDLLLAVAFGLALGAMNLVFYLALDRIPLGVAVTLEFVGPLGVAIAGSRGRLDALWVVLAAAGILLLANPFGESGIDALGAVLALTAGGFWAAYILLAQRAGQRFTGGTGLAIAMVVAALVPLAPGIAVAGSDLLKPEFLAIGAAVAVLSSVIPYSFETEALRHLPSNVFGVLMSLEPAAGALFGFVVADQALAGRELLAIALVVVASAGAARTAPPPPTPVEP